MKKLIILALLFTQVATAQLNLPVNKYKTGQDDRHKERSKSLRVGIGYPVISQFLNPVFVAAQQAGQMQKAGANLSFFADANILYPFSLQIGGYSGTFQPADDLTLSNGSNGKDVEISHELLEGFLCAKLLPNRSRFLPYIGVGYIDGGLKLGKRDDTAKERTILAAIKIQSPAWKVGINIDFGKVSTGGGYGLFIDYTQPFQISGLTPTTFYAANRLQAGLYIQFN